MVNPSHSFYVTQVMHNSIYFVWHNILLYRRVVLPSSSSTSGCILSANILYITLKLFGSPQSLANQNNFLLAIIIHTTRLPPNKGKSILYCFICSFSSWICLWLHHCDINITEDIHSDLLLHWREGSEYDCDWAQWNGDYWTHYVSTH